MTDKYASLVRQLLEEYDVDTELASRPGAASWTKGQADAISLIISYISGYEGTDVAGLRQRFAKTEVAAIDPRGDAVEIVIRACNGGGLPTDSGTWSQAGLVVQALADADLLKD